MRKIKYIDINHQSIQKFDHEPIRCTKIIFSKNSMQLIIIMIIIILKK